MRYRMRERGFIQLSVMAWGAIAAGAVIVALGISLKVQTSRLDSCKEAHAVFVATTKALGDAQNERAKAQELADRQRKESADAQAKRTLDSLRATVAKLRAERAGGSFVPAAASGAASPARACFDRAELERALGDLDKGAQGLVDEGSEAVSGLNAAKAWASGK